MKRKKIVYIQPNGYFSGAAISLQYIINKLDKSKFEPFVIICSEGPLRGYFEKIGVRVFLAPYKTYTTTPSPPIFSFNSFYNFIALFGRNTIKELLNQIKPDIVHVNDKSALLAGIHAYKMGYKVVWHLRSTYYGYKSYLHYFISKQLISNHSSHLIAISEDEIDCFKNSDKLSIVYNSIDFSKVELVKRVGSTFRSEFKILDDEIAIGMIGNIDNQKGVWNFIHAASVIYNNNKNNKKLRFIVVAPIQKNINFGWRGKVGLISTKNPYDKAIVLIKKLGLTENFIFTDRRHDMENVMLGLDIISSVYNMHAIGRPAIEGAAMGRVVVANEGHTRKSKLIISGETGFIVPKEDINTLSEIICKLIYDNDLKERIETQAYIYSRKFFDAELNCRIIEKIYERLITNQN